MTRLRRSSLLLACAILPLLLADGAMASCPVSPAPVLAPLPCDPGGEASESEILACNFEGFRFGTWASVGSGGPGSATVIARRTVFEGQSSSTISSCSVYNPENAAQLLFNADARAVAASDAWEVGVRVTDYVPGRGDNFSQTLEAANAQAAVALTSIAGAPPGSYLDAVIHITGGFSGSSGRPRAQIAVRDLQGRILGAFFAAGRAANNIYWRFLECPDPLVDASCSLGSYVDMGGPFPGSFDLALRVPAEVGNGIWIELKAEAAQDAGAASGQVLSVDFGSTAAVEIIPPEGTSVTLSSGQVFGEAEPPGDSTPFEVATLIEEFNGFDEDRVDGAGESLEEASSQTLDSEAIARGIAGSGRLIAGTDTASGCVGNVTSGLSWYDTVTATGADLYRFEFELAGAVEQVDPGTDGIQFETGWQAGVGFFGGFNTVRGDYWVGDDVRGTCDDIVVGDSCFKLSSELEGANLDVEGSGELGEGPVVVAFEQALPEGVPVAARFGLSVSSRHQSGLGGCHDAPVSQSIDLGTPGRYARLRAVTAESGGSPDLDFRIESANGYDYTRDRELVSAVPEPSSAILWMTALGAVGWLHRTRRGRANRASAV